MKQLLLAVIFFLFGQAQSISLLAQDLSNLFPAAHYTLINTADDALGLQLPLTLMNAPFVGTSGVYSNGLYSGNDPNGSIVRSPLLSTLYDSVFAIQLDFNIAELDGQTRSVLVCGGSYRYLGFVVQSDNTFQMMYNNGALQEITTVFPDENTWHELTILHYEGISLTSFYLDGSWIGELTIPFVRAENDGNILNFNPSNGQTYLGYWRNLRVYGSEVVSGTMDQMQAEKILITYPNPTSTTFTIETSGSAATRWSLVNMAGVSVLHGRILTDLQEIDITHLAPGIYVLHLMDQNGTSVGQQRIVKTHPGT